MVSGKMDATICEMDMKVTSWVIDMWKVILQKLADYAMSHALTTQGSASFYLEIN